MTDYKQVFEDYLSRQRFTGSLSTAIDYVFQNGGQRIRPQLLLAWCEACGGQIDDALPLALAVEFIHTASLIHDDLPCMDNSAERRGRPSLHVLMGEATAVLCGDKLLGLAFDTIIQSNLSTEQKFEAIETLSKALNKMIDGQHLELTTIDLGDVDTWTDIHHGKTASLLMAACVMGVIAAGHGGIGRAELYGASLGMGYQLLDDIRDKDGISSLLSADEIEKLFDTYTSACYLGMDSEPHRFLTKFARRILT